MNNSLHHASFDVSPQVGRAADCVIHHETGLSTRSQRGGIALMCVVMLEHVLGVSQTMFCDVTI